MKIRFYLHNARNKAGEQTLFCAYSHASREWRFSTNIRMKKRDWNQKSQSVSFRHPHAVIINNQVIEPIRQRLTRIALELRAFPDPQSPTPDRVRAVYEGKKETGEFWVCWDRYTESHVATLAKNTQLVYRKLGEILRELESQTGPLSWESFTLEFYHLFKRKLADEGNGQNTIAKRVQTLKTFLKFAHKNDWHSNDKYQFFEVQRQKTLHVALTEEELDRVTDLHLANPGEARARDVFVFHCNTGLRFSELASLKPNDLNRISFRSQKTGKFGQLTLNKKALEIWQKYEGDLPIISDQNYREHIKTICRRAGMTYEVETSKGRTEKWKACSTHTARRTCATMLYRRGVDIRKIQEVLGHATIKQTAIYLKCTEGDFVDTLSALD